MSDGDVALVDQPVPPVGGSDAPPADAPVVEAPGTPTEIIPPGGEPAGGEGAGAERPGGEEDKTPLRTDGRTLPKDIQAALKALRSDPANANVAKTLNDVYFRDKTTFGEKALFKDFEEARITKATVEALGGKEGVADMQAKVQTLYDIDERIERGDSSVIDDMWESPMIDKLVGYGVDKLQKSNSEAYENMIRPKLYEALEGAGLSNIVLSAIEELRAGNTDKAQRNMADIQRWLSGLKENVDRARSAKPDPRIANVEARETKLREEESKAFSGNVARSAISYINSSLEDELANLWGNHRLSDDAKQDLAQGVYNEIEKVMREDGTYQANMKALLRTRNMDRAVSYVKAKVDEVTAKAARTVWNRRYGTIPPTPPPKRPAAPAAPAAPANAAPGARPSVAPLMLATKPTWDQLDMTKDPNRLLFITGKGYLKAGPNAGKLVQWKK